MEHCDIEGKLWDFLCGSVDEATCDQIREWRRESPENEAYFEAYRKDFLYIRWVYRRKLIRQKNFSSLRQRIFRRKIGQYMLKVAAAVTLLLGTSSMVWWLWPVKESQIPFVEVADIQPGKPQATLVLSSGSEIPVAAIDKELHEKDGVKIQVNQQGEILYTDSGEKDTGEEVFNRLSVPRGGMFMLVLADSTRVWLNSATELKYPTAFLGKTRTVYLKGEAYFDVRRNIGRPFVVKTTEDIEIRVFGTEFNVNTYTPGKVETVLVKGKVGVNGNRQAVKLNAGQKADYVKGQNDIRVEEVDVSPYIAWKEGSFIFRNEQLDQIMEKLALWYDIEVFFTTEKLKEVRLSGDMERYEDIRELLYYFEQSSAVKFKIQDRTVIIDHK